MAHNRVPITSSRISGVKLTLAFNHCWKHEWMFHLSFKNEAELDQNIIPHLPRTLPSLPYMNLTRFCTLIKRQVQGKTSRNIYLIKFKTFQATGNPVNNQNRNGCRVVNLFFPLWGFYLNDPLCITAIKQKRGEKKGADEQWRKRSFPQRRYVCC